jgi:hypothetical protein
VPLATHTRGSPAVLTPTVCMCFLLQQVGIHPGPEIPGIALHVVEATVSGITVSGSSPAEERQ